MNTPIMPHRLLANGSHPYTPIRPSSTSSTWSTFDSAPSSPSTGSTAFWKTPPKKEKGFGKFWSRIGRWTSWRLYLRSPTTVRLPVLADVAHLREGWRRVLQWNNSRQFTTNLRGFWERLTERKRSRRLMLYIVASTIFSLLSITLLLAPPHFSTVSAKADVHSLSAFQHVKATSLETNDSRTDPIRWLAENSNYKYAVDTGRSYLPTLWGDGRPRAAIISLVRNTELDGMMQSMRQLEYRWNRKYQYPWVFFNDEPFTEEFKAGTRNSTAAECYYEVVPKEHWSLPSWIDESRFMNSLEYLGTIGVGKGWMVSYHHMCRWNSGFFYKHPFLKNFDWYWRVEPDVHYFCNIDYDVFRFMQDNNLKYGFNMNILDDARSFPSLWSKTRAFAAAHPNLIHPQADPAWLVDSTGEYNNCQFFSNFEIGSLNFWRGEANEAYFNWLDRAGGFYYERFGDAPVHTLSVAMFLPKSEVWFFRDIGYQHDINHHCPPNREGMCACQPTSIDENFYKLVPIESPQRKPVDTCIRQFLGGEWLQKREGWTAEGERAFGGDGYHGYEVW